MSRQHDCHAPGVIYASLGCNFEVIPQLAGYRAVTGNLSTRFGPPHHVDTGPCGAASARDCRKEHNPANLGVGNAVVDGFVQSDAGGSVVLRVNSDNLAIRWPSLLYE